MTDAPNNLPKNSSSTPVPHGPPTRPGDDPMSMTKRAGIIVTVLSTLFIIAVIGLVSMLVWKMESSFTSANVTESVWENCVGTCSELEYAILLEQDAQAMRNHRVRSALASRLLINAVAEVIALTLIALGAVLVFDRVESSREQSAGFWSFTFKSTFPGLIICGMGTVLTYMTVHISASPESRFTVLDLPVHLSDPNWERNYILGQVPGNRPGGLSDDSTEPSESDTGPELTSDALGNILEDLQ